MKEKILVNGMVWGQKEPLVSPIDYDDFIKEMLEAMGQDKASFQVETDFGKMEEGGSKKSLGTIFHVPDPNNPLEVKWALLLPAKSPETEAIAAALKPLVDHRQGQVWFSPKPPAATEPLTWITDHYLQLDDDQKPYYILLAGDPEAIPFRFQYNLDVAAAVGRVFFKNLDDYAQYAKKVVDFETGKDAFVANRAVFFATEHPWQDDVTHISRRYMTNPLVDMVTKMGVQVSYFAGDEATLTNLMSNFGDASTEAPALIFTASHGVAVLDDDEDLRRCLQGALICQDYDGLSGVLAAEQVPTDSFGHGSIVFSFACYGAGTPRQSDFFQWIKYPRLLRCRPAQDFIAALPQKLLQHPQGPLAFIGHIDPAWLYSFAPPYQPKRRQRVGNPHGSLSPGGG